MKEGIESLEDVIQSVKGYMRKEPCYKLYELAKVISNNYCIVELGSYQGRSTCCLGLGSKDGSSAKIYAVDLWGKSEYRTEKQYENNEYKKLFLKNIDIFKLNDIVTAIQHNTNKAQEIWKTKNIGLLLIDAGHSYEEVKQDFLSWFPFVINGGMILFHDYDWRFPDVIKLVQEMHNHYNYIEISHTLYITRKNSK